MDEPRYSVVIRGQTFGPFGLRRLQEFIDSGQIGPTSTLYSVKGHPIQASAIPRLRFPEAPTTSAADPDLVRRFTSEPKPWPRPPGHQGPAVTFGPDPTFPGAGPQRPAASPEGPWPPREPIPGMDTIRCPMCAESIPASATTCAYCGEWVTPDGLPPAPARPLEPSGVHRLPPPPGPSGLHRQPGPPQGSGPHHLQAPPRGSGPHLLVGLPQGSGPHQVQAPPETVWPQPMPHQPVPHQPLTHQPVPHQPVPHQPVPHQPVPVTPGQPGPTCPACGRPVRWDVGWGQFACDHCRVTLRLVVSSTRP